MVSAESSGGIAGEEEMRGLHFKLRLLLAFLHVHIAPEIRYTGWFTVPFDRDTPYVFTVQSARNQVDLLVTMTF